MNNILDEYVRICTRAGVQGEKLYIEMRTVENGLMKLITQYKIERLVMGAAADDRYSRKMVEPKSKKANYVRQCAPDFCHIWFVCKTRLIYTREGTKLPQLNYKLEDRQIALKPRLTPSSSGWSGNISRVNSEESFDDVDQSSTFSLSHLSIFSKSSETATESTPLPISKTEDHEPPFRSLSLPPRREEKRHHSQSANLLKMSTKDSLSLLDQLEQAIADAKIAKQETFQESYRRHQAEKEATDAIAKATATENSFHEELRRRKKLEEELAKAKEELENTKQQRDTALEQLQITLNQNSLLKSQSDKSNAMAEELEDKLRSTLELFQKFRQP
ncbi:U-box domain-containing protein 33-like isoform X2 [Silene latifolia]